MAILVSLLFLPILNACVCTDEQRMDDSCDPDCFSAECSWDNDACAEIECSFGCIEPMIGNGTCDSFCNVAACEFDSNDCEECSRYCPDYRIGNGTCDSECDIEQCSYDGGDCEGEEESGLREVTIILLVVGCVIVVIAILITSLIAYCHTRMRRSAPVHDHESDSDS